jgi:hypothetical protein
LSLLVFFSLFVGPRIGVCLPKPIIELVHNQKSDFESVLAPLSKQQRHLALERYVDLVLSAHFTLTLEIDADELRRFVFAENAYLDKEQESPEKKTKRTPVYSTAMEEELGKILAAFHGQFRGDSLELSFFCENHYFLFPFTIVEMGKKQYEMQLKGVPIQQSGRTLNSDPRCLALDLDLDTPTANLGWIGTQESACPIPGKKGGECLLNLAEAVAKAAGKKSVSLIDASDIKCPINRQQTNLGRLKLYQTGHTWYAQKGYVSDDEPTYEKSIHEFRKYPLDALLKNLTQITPRKDTAHSRQILARESEEFLAPKKGDTVSDFMAWLWKKDCSAYMDVDTFITSPFMDLEFAQKVPRDLVMHKDL